MAEYTPESRDYELMVLLSPELGEESLESEMQRISDQITSTEAEIVSTKSTTPWGRRRLAYQINNHNDAFYVLYSISSQPGKLDPFERELKLNTNVLRYLLIRQDKADPVDEELEVGDESEEISEPEEAEAAAVASGEEAQDVSEVTAEPEAEVSSAVTDEAEDAPADGTEEEQA